MKNILFFTIGLITSQITNAQIFTQYLPANSSDFQNNSIRHLAFDNLGQLYCATNGDSLLIRFNNGSWTYYGENTYGFVQSGSNPVELTIDPTNNDIYISHFETIDQFDGSITTNINTTSTTLLNNFIKGMAINSNGDQLIGLNNGFGLALVTSSSWTNKGDYSGAYSSLNNVFTPGIVAVDPYTDDFWVMYGSTIYQIKSTSVIEHAGGNIPFSLSNISDMTVTSNGDVWFSFNNSDPLYGGLLKFDGASWTHLNTSNSSISSNAINTIDAFGSHIIFGSTVPGVHRYDAGVFTTYDDSNSNWGDFLPSQINEILSNDTEIFLGMPSGLIIMSPPFVSGIEEKHISVSIYPNPSSEIITIESEALISSVELIAVDGKRIPVTLENNQINVSHVSVGNYTLNIKFEGQMIQRSVVIKDER